jgi:hypothetical protein
MSVARITEITAQSPEGFDQAIRHGIERAVKTLDNVQSAWVKDHEIILKNDKIEFYRVHMKITFVLNE